MAAIEIDKREWINGFLDGEDGRPARPGATGYSYYSGWIEGDAKRQGFEYSLGVLTEEEMKSHRERRKSDGLQGNH